MTSKAAQKLLSDPRVDEFENDANTDGRWFLSLRPEFCWIIDGEARQIRTVRGASDGLRVLRDAVNWPA